MGEPGWVFQGSPMGQNGREKFPQQNGTAHGFLNKFINYMKLSARRNFFFLQDNTRNNIVSRIVQFSIQTTRRFIIIKRIFILSRILSFLGKISVQL